MNGIVTTRAAQPRVQPTRSSRSNNWLVMLAKVRVGDPVFPDSRGRLRIRSACI